MNDLVLIRLKGGANDYNLELGFIPKMVKVTVIDAANSLPDEYYWYGEMQEDSDESSSGSWEYGVKIHGADGVRSYCDTVAKGISAYDGAKVPQVLVESPVPGKGLEKANVVPFVAGTTAPTQRSTTIVGTITRPSTATGYVYECSATAGVYGTEPTWPTTPGESVSDGTNTWICREENIVANKGLGITLGGTLLTTDKIAYIEAYKAIRCEDIGDIG